MSAPAVLIAAGCPHATVTRYRCLHLQEQLAANGVAAAVETWYDLDAIDGERPLPTRALVLQRVAMTPALDRLIDRMHAAGLPVIFDVDDLVFEPQLAPWHRGVKNLPPAEQALYLQGVRRYQATLARCDAVLTASPLLAELAGRHGPAAYVHRNALGAEMLAWADQLYAMRSRRAGGKRIVLGYGSGTPTHDVDFDEAAPALIDILTRYPQTELWIAGPMHLAGEFALFGARVRRFPLLDWRTWFETAAQLDIALAPLEADNLFCRAKSEIKFVEAAALGAPVVASHIDPFAATITPGENGFLAANTQEWIAALEALVTDAGLRARIAEAARCTVEQRYTPAARAADLGAILPDLLAAPVQPQSARHAKTITAPAMNHNNHSAPPPAAGAAQAAATPAAPAEQPFTPLTLNWLVTEPFPGSGGHTGIFRMIRHLVEFGHICHVYTIPVNFMHQYTPAQVERYVTDHFMPTGAIYHMWSGETGPADATIATYWKTVALLLKLPLAGRRYYLVQDFEPSFYPVGSEYIQAENTYRHGLHCLTLGPWLAKLMAERYGAEADHFDFAVDTDVYSPIPAPRPAHPRVAFYARPSTPRRAYELGLAALKLIAQRQPGVEIIFYGADKLNPAPAFPHTNMGILNQWELAKLFSTCDIGVVFSTTNPSFVPFEMMACRCAVVDLASERVEGLLEDGVNCRLADPTPESIADTVLDLVWNKEQRAAIVETAYQQVRSLSWRHSARQIEAVLLRNAPPPEQRTAYRAAATDDIDMLAWQIHQLLDAGDGHAATVDALREVLYRTLAEKALLLQHVAAVEASFNQARRAGISGRARTAIQPLADKVTGGAPIWLLGKAPLARLPLDAEPFVQSFTADRSHLARLELCFAHTAPVHTGSLRFALYEGDEGGRLVASDLLRVADLPADQPVAIDFPAQVDSFGKTYTFTLVSAEANSRPPAIWHFWQPQHAGAQLRHGGHALNGQLAFQPCFRERTAYLPARQGPGAWGQPIKLAPTFAVEVAGQRSREVLRLGSKARAAVRERGVAGLVREVMNYVEWQLNKGGE